MRRHKLWQPEKGGLVRAVESEAVVGAGALERKLACAGAWTPDQELFGEIEYRGHFMQFRVNGIPVATVNQPVNFVTVPTIVYYGSLQASGQQIDAVYKEI